MKRRLPVVILLTAGLMPGAISALPANQQQSNPMGAKHDPFESPIAKTPAESNVSARGHWTISNLLVKSLRVDGIVKISQQPLAIVTNGSGHTFFLREGDHLYDGAVDKISMDGVTFHEAGKDAFGKPFERQVNKRIYSSAGEQQ